MRIIFAGTPEFARTALQRLHQAGHTIALVLTQPDRPAGRGMKMQSSAVKQYALEHAMPVAQPRSLRLDGKFPEEAAQAREAILAAQADVMVVAAYGLILPQWVLDSMSNAGAASHSVAPQAAVQRKYGCLNIHGSLLPRWRGAAPIHRAIEQGDRDTGVTIMQMDAGLDTGDMLLSQSLPVADTDTTATLHDKVANLGAELIVQALALAEAGQLAATPQPAEGVCYAHKIEKTEAAIDWALSSQAIARRVRAFNPFPGASLEANGEVIKVWRAQAQDTAHQSQPGQVLAAGPAGIDVATGQGVLRLLELQRPGGKRLAVADFVRGFDMPAGTLLGVAGLDVPAAGQG